MALQETDTERFRDRPLGTLSGGEQQRVALALALAQEADILLLDEPTSHLDPAQAQAVLDLVQGLRRQRHLTVVAVLHDLNLASLYADRILLLHQGALIADGAPPDVIRASVLEPVYGPALRYVLHPELPLPPGAPPRHPPEALPEGAAPTSPAGPARARDRQFPELVVPGGRPRGLGTPGGAGPSARPVGGGGSAPA